MDRGFLTSHLHTLVVPLFKFLECFSKKKIHTRFGHFFRTRERLAFYMCINYRSCFAPEKVGAFKRDFCLDSISKTYRAFS